MRTSIEEIWYSQLIVDARLQRPLRKRWCEQQAKEFDPRGFRPLEVSLRANGAYVIIDGQHRWHMLQLMGYTDQLVECRVHRGLSFEDENRLFNRLNNFRRPQYYDWFVHELQAKNPMHVEIDAILREFQLRIDRTIADRVINAVRALVHVYEGDHRTGSGRNPKALRDTLRTLIAAWGGAAENFQGHLIEGVGLMFLRDDAKLDRGHLAAVLAKQGSANRLVGRAKQAKESHSCQVPRAVAGVATDLYNKGRRTNKLPSWWTE